MNDLILLTASLGFAFLITKKEGPFNILSKLRDYLFSNKYIGVSLFKLINCAFCSGFWLGIIFHIFVENFSKYSIVFGFATGFASYVISYLIDDNS